MSIPEPIRNRKRALSPAEARSILARATHGVLATVDADGQPYAVPLNHVLVGEALYAHCALEGHKLRNIAFEPRVSYCAVAEAEVDPVGLSTFYASAILFGRATLLVDRAQKRTALLALLERMGAPAEAGNLDYLERMLPETAVLRIAIEHLTAKAHPRP